MTIAFGFFLSRLSYGESLHLTQQVKKKKGYLVPPGNAIANLYHEPLPTSLYLLLVRGFPMKG